VPKKRPASSRTVRVSFSPTEDADAYCEHRGKSAVVMRVSESDATSGTLAAPGKLARATVEFRCQ